MQIDTVTTFTGCTFASFNFLARNYDSFTWVKHGCWRSRGDEDRKNYPRKKKLRSRLQKRRSYSRSSHGRAIICAFNIAYFGALFQEWSKWEWRCSLRCAPKPGGRQRQWTSSLTASLYSKRWSLKKRRMGPLTMWIMKKRKRSYMKKKAAKRILVSEYGKAQRRCNSCDENDKHIAPDGSNHLRIVANLKNFYNFLKPFRPHLTGAWLRGCPSRDISLTRKMMCARIYYKRQGSSEQMSARRRSSEKSTRYVASKSSQKSPGRPMCHRCRKELESISKGDSNNVTWSIFGDLSPYYTVKMFRRLLSLSCNSTTPMQLLRFYILLRRLITIFIVLEGFARYNAVVEAIL